MDKVYDEIFNLNDKEDAYYHSIIPSVDIEIFRNALEEDLRIINSTYMDVPVWARYKYNLMKEEDNWRLNIFKWGVGSNARCPYVYINIDWDKLESKPSRYFLVYMALEGNWMED